MKPYKEKSKVEIELRRMFGKIGFYLNMPDVRKFVICEGSTQGRYFCVLSQKQTKHTFDAN